MQHHGQGCRQPGGGDAKEEDGGLMTHPHQTDLPQAIPSGQSTVCHGGSDMSTLSHLTEQSFSILIHFYHLLCLLFAVTAPTVFSKIIKVR